MKFRYSVFLGLLMLCTIMPAGTGHAATASVTATAVIQAATLSATKVTDINFGTIVSTSVASAIRIDASGGAATPATAGGTATVTGGTSGLVTVTSNINANVTITYAIVGSQTNVETIENATASMGCTNANITANSTPSGLAVTVAGPNQIHVGGEIAVGANQAAGTYTGTCTVTVTY